MLTWKIPLGLPPQVALAGRAQHGYREVETYRLPQLWCVHLYEYEAELRLNGTPVRIRPGSAGVVPPGVMMEYQFRGKSPHIYAHFTVPSAGRQDLQAVPALQDLGGAFADVYRAFADVPRWITVQPRRAAGRLWDILWRLTDPPVAAHTPASAVERVRELVETHLAEPIYIADIARQVGYSQNHLTRLFRAEMGLTVVDYIRQRRVQRARHLLQKSTLPIKAIAAEVGIPDLHLFNKVIRQALGSAPRTVRAV